MPESRRDPLKILLLTDVFPPKSGGSGWSTYYLGNALLERGNSVRVLRPRYDIPVANPTLRKTTYARLSVEEVLVPPAPHLAERAGLGRAWREREAVTRLTGRATRLSLQGEVNVLHGQHKVSAMATSIAARRARPGGATVIALATVRDYWPLCPVSTRLFTTPGGEPFECKECHRLGDYLRAVKGEGRALGINGLLDLARWVSTWRASHLLAGCDMTIAVSRYVRDEIALSARVPGTRLVSIPNMVDLPSVERALDRAWPLEDISPENPFMLFVGKFDVNKGAQMLPEAVQRSEVRLPVLLLGDGPLKENIDADARSRGLDFRFYDWLDNDAVMRVMTSALVLLFPSAWQEPLSRVLLEGCAAGAAIVALDTGGTSDVIVDGVSGWLARDLTAFVEGIKATVTDDSLNKALRKGARSRAESVFAAPRVAGEIETLYLSLLEARMAQ